MAEKPRLDDSGKKFVGRDAHTGRFRTVSIRGAKLGQSALAPIDGSVESVHFVSAGTGELHEPGWVVRAGLRYEDGRTEDVDLLISQHDTAGHDSTGPSSGPTDSLTRTLELVSSARPREAADQLVSDWLSVLDDAVSARHATSGTLTESQRTWLLESDAMTDDQITTAQDDVRAGALERKIATIQARAVLDSLSPQEVAELLGISTSTVSHRRADGSLYGIAFGRSRRYPTWQFVGNRPLPHLPRLIAAISPEVHPATIDGLMRTPQPELAIDGRATEPHLWLSNGGAIEPVLQLLDRDNRE